MGGSLGPISLLTRTPTFPCRYRGFILLLTFLIYTCYHMSRKPISVVKVRLASGRKDAGDAREIHSRRGARHSGQDRPPSYRGHRACSFAWRLPLLVALLLQRTALALL